VIGSNPNATPPRFLLAYHYLVEGNTDAAAVEFANVVKLEPKDQLSASLAKALTKAKESTTLPATATGPVLAGAPATTAAPAASTPAAATTTTAASSASPPATAPAEPSPPPPAELTGTWKAAPTPDTAITLALQADGEYTWDVANKGQTQGTISGRAVYVNNVLSLTQEEGPPLAGKIESKDSSKFVFRLMGGGRNAPALTFTR
jgi:hypothetical protein